MNTILNKLNENKKDIFKDDIILKKYVKENIMMKNSKIKDDRIIILNKVKDINERIDYLNTDFVDKDDPYSFYVFFNNIENFRNIALIFLACINKLRLDGYSRRFIQYKMEALYYIIEILYNKYKMEDKFKIINISNHIITKTYKDYNIHIDMKDFKVTDKLELLYSNTFIESDSIIKYSIYEDIGNYYIKIEKSV